MDTHSALTFLKVPLSYSLLVADTQVITMLVFLLLVLLLLAFTISGAEVAIFSLNSRDINMLKTKQHPAARRIIDLLERPKEVFATLLIASILINICIIVLSNFLIGQFMTFRGLSPALVIFLKMLMIAPVIIFLGEILPKFWATQNNLRFAYGTVSIVEVVHWLLGESVNGSYRWPTGLADGWEQINRKL